MTQAQHTPGPWRWSKCRTLQHLHDDKGSCFAGVSMPQPNNRRGIWAEKKYSEQLEANACLIAAAPELLEALEKVMLRWSDYLALVNTPNENPKYVEQAKQYEEQACTAIAKARGEAV